MPQLLQNNLGLYGQLQGNTGLYGLGVPTPEQALVSSEAISFNNFGLQNETYKTLFKHEDAPNRDFITSPAPRSPGAILTMQEWREKTISIEGTIVAESQADLETAIDDLKANLEAESGNLDIDFAGKKRRYVA